MASCDSFRLIFESPLSEKPTLRESLPTWNHKKSGQPVEVSSFTELFGELHFKESLESSSLPFLPPIRPPSSLLLDLCPKPKAQNVSGGQDKKKVSLESLLGAQKNQEMSRPKSIDGFTSMNSESLHMCTEGLGFESFDDADDPDSSNTQKQKMGALKHSMSEMPFSEYRKLRSFPPPIPSIGRNGKPWVSYKSIRQDGRLVLKEMMIPTQGQEFMHACREDGRLTLHLVHRDEDVHDKEKAKSEEVKEDGDDAEEERKTETDDMNGSFFRL